MKTFLAKFGRDRKRVNRALRLLNQGYWPPGWPPEQHVILFASILDFRSTFGGKAAPELCIQLYQRRSLTFARLDGGHPESAQGAKTVAQGAALVGVRSSTLGHGSGLRVALS